MNKIILHNPIDMHLHLREGAMLDSVLPFTAKAFSAALAMPNLKTPVTTLESALSYKEEILSSCAKSHCEDFMPLMSIFLTPSLDRTQLEAAKQKGIKILKLYPKGSTTGSEGGVSEILDDEILEIFSIAEELGFILSVHGESNGFCMEREFEFLEVFRIIARDFPHLQTIIEHISDRRSLELIESCPSLYGTLTLHHISFNLNDLCGGMLNPHLFCKPMLKTKKDQEALLDAALNAHSKLSFGSDSAPHLESAKLSQKGAAGIFSAPILLPALTELFEAHNALDNLQAFVSDNAIANYALNPSRDFIQKCVTLIPKSHKAPSSIETRDGAIVPLYAGREFAWRIENIESLDSETNSKRA